MGVSKEQCGRMPLFPPRKGRNEHSALIASRKCRTWPQWLSASRDSGEGCTSASDTCQRNWEGPLLGSKSTIARGQGL